MQNRFSRSLWSQERLHKHLFKKNIKVNTRPNIPEFNKVEIVIRGQIDIHSGLR